jgi:hypothetical protein
VESGFLALFRCRGAALFIRHNGLFRERHIARDEVRAAFVTTTRARDLLMHALYQVKECCGPASPDGLRAGVCAKARNEKIERAKHGGTRSHNRCKAKELIANLLRLPMPAIGFTIPERV